MNENDELAVTAFARSWQIETPDIVDRVAKRIDDRPQAELLMEQLLTELRSVRSELAALRNENKNLRTELASLRSDLGSRRATRITPFSPSENFARISAN